MHDLSNIITALGTLIGATSLIIKAWTNNTKGQRKNFDDMAKHLEDIIDQKNSDIDLYRKRWLTVERENDRLKNELEKTKDDN